MVFSYSPLPGVDALRLLTLKPGEFFDPLEADLVPTTFSTKPRYIGLSYTWDEPDPEQSDLPASFTKRVPDSSDDHSQNQELAECRIEATLALDGHDVPIKHNLALALRYMRSATHPLTLWVDAVCINQADIDERNSQVALMDVIYSRAVAVATWLGLNKASLMSTVKTFDEDVGIQAAMTMRDAYDLGNSKMLAPWLAEHIAAQSSAGARRLPESRAAAEKEALERLAAGNQLRNSMVMETRYWQRVWVVQEICLTQRVFFLYGPTLYVNEGSVKNAQQTKAIKASSGMDNMLRARGRRFGEYMRLEMLIEEFAGHLCTDTRDKIYGLVGLANDVNAVKSSGHRHEEEDNSGDGNSPEDAWGEDVSFPIDYRRSFYDIWCDAVHYRFRCPYYFVPPEFFKKQSRHYFVPPEVERERTESESLRHDGLTKLIRFAALVQNTLLNEVERELALPTASSVSERAARLQGPKLFRSHLVPARGYLAGKILDLGPTYAEFVGSSRCQTTWRTGWRKHYRKERDLEKLREIEEQYAANILEYGEADVSRIARIQGDPFVAFPSSRSGPIDELTSRPIDADGQFIIKEMLADLSTPNAPEHTRNGEVRRFLATDQCMGLAPPGAAVGDWVIRFWNCDAAIIVRPDDATAPNSSCSLVGRADVADIYRQKDGFDRVANGILFPYGHRGEKYIDMLMTWHTLQRITASIST
ncbi:heterokaryon incompatibility protein-domain-containing protein [Xylaria nigripes]|nr:heterokaryon incompatibility protein-domain-containing protein [Xylaria nigripes]